MVSPLSWVQNEWSHLLGRRVSYRDNVEDMTWGRRVARYLSNFEWYFPSSRNFNHPEPPSIDKAWEYFEHVTLARRFQETEEGDDENRKAEIGELEAPTMLYPLFKTQESDLGEFGIGVAIYFYTLRLLSIIMLVAGLLNLPNLIYFFSETYNPLNENIKSLSLRASAICTAHSWEACPTCTKQDWDRFPPILDRYAEVSSSNGTILTFIKVNQCEITDWVGIFPYISLVFICIAFIMLRKATEQEQIKLDNASLTTTDYAVIVENPPKDARDPDEWKTFFDQFGQVASVTVALDNEELLRALLHRRILMLMLEDLLPIGITLEPSNLDRAFEQASPLTFLQRCMMTTDSSTIKAKIDEIDQKIKLDLVKRVYVVSKVFIIFEMNHSQHKALEKLSIGGINVMMNNKSVLPEKFCFRGKHVLRVGEPPEPSSVRWQDLDESFLTKVIHRIITFLLTFALITISCILVLHVRKRFGTAYAAMTITAANSMFPSVCLYITDVESHNSENSRQASYYFKVTASKWILTTFLTAYLTPFTDTLNDDRKSLIPAMYAIFITELLKTPVTKILDLPGQFNRHILAPRALDQRRMNSYFKGTKYQLSERYTDMSNVLFLTFYYALIFPAGFFWSSATLMVRYWVDKFCLLRSWAPAPTLGTSIAELSRVFFFSGAVVVYAIMSSYNYASFPYDNACQLDDPVPTSFIGSFTGQVADGTTVQFSIAQGARTFRYCNQDMLRYDPWPAFPAVPSSQPKGSEWMGPGQNFAFIFGWTSVIICAVVIFRHLHALSRLLFNFLFGGFVTFDKPHNKGFSETTNIYGYIPQFKLEADLFPTLLCDVSSISHDLIDWEDPADPSKTRHNAIYDVAGICKSTEAESVLSIVRDWRPGEDCKRL